ncbi:MAG TPA: archaemetzincin family Zn-dependent metalloprotease [Methanospirillum sp.]|nr:archaemetzincin family Zn-dependent metalloprotease [Methanospirillum sp.]
MDIQIIWDHRAPRGLEVPVARLITQVLDIPVHIGSDSLLYNGYKPERSQFDASSILSCLDIYKRRNSLLSPLLFVIGDDIYRPGFRYVFGLSRPRTGAAVVSSARLTNEFWDLPTDDRALTCRLVTEGSHEIGHLLGLDHCDDERCIMFNPRSLDDLDRKKPWLCDNCRNRVKYPA